MKRYTTFAALWLVLLAWGCLGAHSTSTDAGAPDGGGDVFVDQLRQTAITKIDLLFMIDNSASMADKQEILSDAIPPLLDRLINPDCVDVATGAHSPGMSTCPVGALREFSPINDMHIGVVTSSLGGHGGDLCAPVSTTWVSTQDDHAHLLPTVRTGLESYQNLGFLAWRPGDAAAIEDPTQLVSALEPYLGSIGAGETGCGYESQLESWYRFLIDPDPPNSVVLAGSNASVDGPDQVVLDQRRQFLRADSLLAIIMLTDENDCSIVDGGSGWIVASSVVGSSAFRMPSATSTCASDPNSPCCRSCGVTEGTPPVGCTPVGQDPTCAASRTLSATADPLNLRCWDQKRRFGVDLLYPTSRYVTGLTSATVKNRAGDSVPNPIYSDLSLSGVVPRDPSLVFLMGIVGVPWQDIADDASLTGPGLRYLTAAELQATDRWSVILGDPAASPPAPPADALMVESNVPRSGSSYYPPGASLGSSTSTDPQENVINGHEYTPNPNAGDLEYACIFPLATARTCGIDDPACDCVPDTDGGTTAIRAANKPLCQPPGGGVPGATQYWAKAYPSLRELQVLHDFGNNSIVASICPKGNDPSDTANYGYGPAVSALIDRVSGVLVGRCFPRSLSLNCDGTLPCQVIEARSGGCDCAAPGYTTLTGADTALTVRRQLQVYGYCGGVGQTACESWCLCAVTQLENDPACTTQVTPPASAAGYCYIDANQAIGNPALVQMCPATQARTLRFVGNDIPAAGAVVFMSCVAPTTCGGL